MTNNQHICKTKPKIKEDYLFKVEYDTKGKYWFIGVHGDDWFDYSLKIQITNCCYCGEKLNGS